MSIPHFKITKVLEARSSNDTVRTTSLMVFYSTLPSGVTVSITGGTLQYSLSGGTTWVTVPLIQISQNSFKIVAVPRSETYHLQLRVYNATGIIAITDLFNVTVTGTGSVVPPVVHHKNNTHTQHTHVTKHTQHKKKVITHLPNGKGKVPKDHKGNTVPKSPLGLHGYQWNLPPHQWSMPIEPSRDSLVVNTASYIEGSSHKFRRGRIYWYSRVDSSYLTSKDYNSGSDKKDPRYGFQFLWNPSEIQTQVAMNLNVTPSFADKFVDVAGAFPSGEYLSFTIRIDRTNDFACIKTMPKNLSEPVGPNSKNYTTYDRLATYYSKSEFYSGNNSLDANFGQTFTKKIKDLQKYGTLADIEYLYKAINGPGWTNVATGRDSSDIGFLSPTLLRVDIGPLSYLGYVNSMGISHISFSRNMVPMISEVSIQFNLMATAGLATK
jgi:hypothetical protein